MKKHILILIFISLANLTFAQYTTPNTGVNWSLSDLVINSAGVVTGTAPNFTISNKIVVSANDRVYIQPGTVVTFTGSTSGFEVNGKFYAVGTAADSIIFTSTSNDTTGAAYDGFRFGDTSVDTACVISYARIEYAYYALRCIGASPTFSNNYVYKCRRGGTLSSSSNPIFTYNKVERCYEYGITLTTGSSPLIEYNEFYNNNSQNTSPKNQVSVGTQGNNSPSIKYNLIHGGMFNRTGGISISALFSGSSSSSEIAYNEIYNNSFGMVFGGGDITCYVHNNKIYNNNINPDVNTTGSGININGSNLNIPIISENEIYGNHWGITILGSTTQPIPNIGNIENASSLDDGKNILYNNVQGANVYDLYNNTGNLIYAQNNDWRVYDSLSIEQHIVHQADSSIYGLVKFTPFSQFIPVELISFDANLVGSAVSLLWQTATETNNKGFVVERSYTNQNNWRDVGFVHGKGTTTEKQNYKFEDKKVNAGLIYYRLKQIDFDGRYQYSSVLQVKVEVPRQFEISQNYPNPFNPKTTIKYELAVNSNVKLTLFNVLGEQIKLLLNAGMPSGTHEFQLDAAGLNSGVYFYRIEAWGADGTSFIKTKKLVLTK
ncbi:MAG: hypothetical protein CO127_02260 [Ignavibacteria bacterium CG_4_9_14_3_um_filter_36_18]|nr:MAG: hypothetical protein CO127_02260 [Ignavibacteria bacterium CG_4_9_14_3_um_filter_36_18]